MEYRLENGFSGSYLYATDSITGKEEKYDVTGLVSISREYEYKDCKHDMLNLIIKELSIVGRQIEKANKNIEGLLLDPECIFIGNRNNSKPYVRFIYSELNIGKSLSSSLNRLSEYIIEHTDHKDKKAVILAYAFYEQIRVGNYVFDPLISN